LDGGVVRFLHGEYEKQRSKKMKTAFCLALLFCLSLSLGCGPGSGTTNATKHNKDTVATELASESSVIKITDQIVEASCGQCQFEMEGSGCDLAVRIDGKTYYVDGSNIDDHGNAHGDDGLCNCIRKAKVTGEIKDGRFVATVFKVVPKDD